MSERVLLVEDDDRLAELLSDEISELGFRPERAADGKRGLEMASSGAYCLILLDIQLPLLSGLEVCRQVRQQGVMTPILVVSSKSTELDKVLLLELGADDYIVKPFSTAELKARIKALLRRSALSSQTGAPEETVFTFEDLTIDIEKRRVVRGGTVVELTAREFDILSLLILRPGRPYTKEEIVDDIYGEQGAGYASSVPNHINRIRNKIEDDAQDPRFVLTVRGVGYCFTDGSGETD
jgi:DNA-binding response OmpR family regulator